MPFRSKIFNYDINQSMLYLSILYKLSFTEHSDGLGIHAATLHPSRKELDW